jgi:hypothetical protein
MTKRTIVLAITLGALLSLLAIRVTAQTRELVADIPFSFTVCNRQMPAGTYTVRSITSSTPNLLLVRSKDNQSAEIACTHDVQGSKRTTDGKLIFNRYGDQYFLSELWFPGEMTGNQVFKTEREEVLIRELLPKGKHGRVTIRVTEAKPN